jgi:hypothetical protein
MAHSRLESASLEESENAKRWDMGAPGFIYNVTIGVAEPRAEEWLTWMRREHIPEVLQTGLFLKAILVRVRGHEQEGSATFAVQYHCESTQLFERYETEYAPGLQAKSAARFAEDAHAFRTLLEVVETFTD